MSGKNPGRPPFRRQANPLPAVFRLGAVYSLNVLPAWFIFRDFTREGIPKLLGLLFSVLIVLLVGLIRLQRVLNGPTERRVDAAVAASSAADGTVRLRQSFSRSEYVRMNLEVSGSYLRPWITLLGGLVFLTLFALALTRDAGAVKSVLALLLSLYYLVIPWTTFLVRTRRAYRRNRRFLEDQEILVAPASLHVRAAEGVEREFRALEDIAVTPGYLLLFVAGTNYVQLKRRTLGPDNERAVLAAARDLLKSA